MSIDQSHYDARVKGLSKVLEYLSRRVQKAIDSLEKELAEPSKIKDVDVGSSAWSVEASPKYTKGGRDGSRDADSEETETDSENPRNGVAPAAPELILDESLSSAVASDEETAEGSESPRKILEAYMEKLTELRLIVLNRTIFRISDTDFSQQLFEFMASASAAGRRELAHMQPTDIKTTIDKLSELAAVLISIIDDTERLMMSRADMPIIEYITQYNHISRKIDSFFSSQNLDIFTKGALNATIFNAYEFEIYKQLSVISEMQQSWMKGSLYNIKETGQDEEGTSLLAWSHVLSAYKKCITTAIRKLEVLQYAYEFVKQRQEFDPIALRNKVAKLTRKKANETTDPTGEDPTFARLIHKIQVREAMLKRATHHPMNGDAESISKTYDPSYYRYFFGDDDDVETSMYRPPKSVGQPYDFERGAASLHMIILDYLMRCLSQFFFVRNLRSAHTPDLLIDFRLYILDDLKSTQALSLSDSQKEYAKRNAVKIKNYVTDQHEERKRLQKFQTMFSTCFLPLLRLKIKDDTYEYVNIRLTDQDFANLLDYDNLNQETINKLVKRYHIYLKKFGLSDTEDESDSIIQEQLSDQDSQLSQMITNCTSILVLLNRWLDHLLILDEELFFSVAFGALGDSMNIWQDSRPVLFRHNTSRALTNLLEIDEIFSHLRIFCPSWYGDNRDLLGAALIQMVDIDNYFKEKIIYLPMYGKVARQIGGSDPAEELLDFWGVETCRLLMNQLRTHLSLKDVEKKLNLKLSPDPGSFLLESPSDHLKNMIARYSFSEADRLFLEWYFHDTHTVNQEMKDYHSEDYHGPLKPLLDNIFNGLVKGLPTFEDVETIRTTIRQMIWNFCRFLLLTYGSTDETITLSVPASSVKDLVFCKELRSVRDVLNPHETRETLATSTLKTIRRQKLSFRALIP